MSAAAFVQLEGTVSYDYEDGDAAMIGSLLVDRLDVAVASDGCLFVRIQSWDEENHHTLARQLDGKRVRVSIEILEAQ